MTYLVLTLLVLLIQQSVVVQSCGRGSISLENNGYRGVLVAIGDSVPEDAALIQRIKDVFTGLSSFMHQITRKRVYLQDITILVPRTWSDQVDYEPVKKHSVDISDVLIDKADPQHQAGDVPFVIKTTPCGEPGHYMHLTPDFLLKPGTANKLGGYNKVLMHEWGHLRYGVFDEFARDEGQPFFADQDGETQGTRCSMAISGEFYNQAISDYGCDYDNGLPDKNCLFEDRKDLSGKYASLMYRQYLPYISDFCDKDASSPLTLHSQEPPSPQNIHCQSRSVWEVMRAHPDFSGGANPPRDVPTTVPSFKVVRQKGGRRTVLVLDVSGSMKNEDRIGKLGQSCSHFIANLAEDGEEIGIVWFSSSVTLQQPLTTVSKASRRDIIDSLPTTAHGSTTIGGGVQGGLDLLNQTGVTAGGTLIVVSDGKENRSPYIRNVWDTVLASNVVIHSIAITDETDSKLDALAAATGGMSFLYSAKDKSNALNEAFVTIAETNLDPSRRKLTVRSEALTLDANQVVLGEVILDSTIGKNTEFIFDYSGTTIEVFLKAPSGEKFDTSSSLVDHDPTFGIYTFAPRGTAVEGKWLYEIRNKDSQSQRVAITVTSQSPSQTTPPIVAHAFWSTRNVRLAMPGGDRTKQALYVSVSKGYVPVLNANVTGEVETPQGLLPVFLTMRDNGAGADVTLNDGIYSSYFLNFDGNGRYNVKVNVNGQSRTVVSPRRILGQGAAQDQSRDAPADVPAPSFERVVSAGSFELDGYTPAVAADMYPPARITDLRVTAVNYDLRQVTLQWTATGAQLDMGTADYYELRYGTDFQLLLTNFSSQALVADDMVVSGSNLSQPLSAGEEERLVLIVPKRGNLRFVFAILAHSRNDTSPMSNIATASMKYRPPTWRLSPGQIAAIVLSVIGFLGLGIALTIFAVKIFVLRKPQAEKS